MSDIPTITIDLNKKCPQCGKTGTVNDGICLNCRAKNLRIPKETTVSPINAAPETLCVMATDVFAKDDKPHWSTASAILGRINDEALYSTDFFGKYATLEAYAKDLLELTKGEVGMALKLWRLIKRYDEAAVGFSRWAEVKRARALLLIEVLEAGAEPVTWWLKMQSAPTTLDFEMEVRHFLKEQVWAWFKVKVPLDVLGGIEAALQRVAQVETLGPDHPGWRKPEDATMTPAQMAESPTYRWMLLEGLAVHYLQTVEAPQLEIDEVTKAVTGEGL